MPRAQMATRWILIAENHLRINMTITAIPTSISKLIGKSMVTVNFELQKDGEHYDWVQIDANLETWEDAVREYALQVKANEEKLEADRLAIDAASVVITV